jgi:hypothetical protein
MALTMKYTPVMTAATASGTDVAFAYAAAYSCDNRAASAGWVAADSSASCMPVSIAKSEYAPNVSANKYPAAASRYARNASGCAMASSSAPFADLRSHGGFDHSSVSLGLRLSHTDSPHSGQYLSSRCLRNDVPQRRHGFSRARGSD